MDFFYCACYGCNLTLKNNVQESELIPKTHNHMKKVLVITAIIILACLNSLVAQVLQINPIPSYNVQLSQTLNGFQEHKKHVVLPLREKREMDVVITSNSTNPLVVFATVWIVKDNGSVVLGPFTTYPDEQLSVPIDNGQWGVVIKSDFDISASVWTE